MRTFCRIIVTTALAVTVFFSALAVSPASARAMHRHHARHHRRVMHAKRSMHAMRPMHTTRQMSPGIGTHGTATTGAGEGTSTNMVPAGGTNADPLGGGTTSAGTATTGTGTSNK